MAHGIKIYSKTALQLLVKKHLGPTSKSLRQNQAASDDKLLASMQSRTRRSSRSGSTNDIVKRKKLIIQSKRDHSTIAMKEFPEGRTPFEMITVKGEAEEKKVGHFGEPEPNDQLEDKNEGKAGSQKGSIKIAQMQPACDIYCENCKKRVRDYEAHLQEKEHRDFWDDPCNYSELLDFLVNVVDKTTLAWQNMRKKARTKPIL